MRAMTNTSASIVTLTVLIVCLWCLSCVCVEEGAKPVPAATPIAKESSASNAIQDIVVFTDGQTNPRRVVAFHSVYNSTSPSWAGIYDHGRVFAYHPTLGTVPRGTYVVQGDAKVQFKDIESIEFVKVLDENITEVSVNYKRGGHTMGYVLHSRASFVCVDPTTGNESTISVTRIKKVAFVPR